MSKEIPINCEVCAYCIQDENGEFFCSFNESNPNLLGLLECHEIKLGIISLVEFLEKRDKRLSALEEKINVLEKKTQTELLEYKNEYSLRPISLLKNALDRIEALESDIKLLKTKLIELFEKLNEQLKDVIILPNFKKQLEGKKC